MIDFYVDEFFEFDNQLYGRLRIHSDESFIRFVKITKMTKETLNWISVSISVEKKAKKYFERLNKSKK